MAAAQIEASLSYLVTIRRKSLRRQKARSTRLRRLQTSRLNGCRLFRHGAGYDCSWCRERRAGGAARHCHRRARRRAWQRGSQIRLAATGTTADPSGSGRVPTSHSGAAADSARRGSEHKGGHGRCGFKHRTAFRGTASRISYCLRPAANSRRITALSLSCASLRRVLPTAAGEKSFICYTWRFRIGAPLPSLLTGRP